MKFLLSLFTFISTLYSCAYLTEYYSSRWWAYPTIFLSIVIIVGSLVCSVIYFIDGE